MNPASEKGIASKRIELLMQSAESTFKKEGSKTNRYSELAKKIAMRYNIKFPKKWKRRVCKKCMTFLVPGANCRVRTRSGIIIITCLNCGSISRIPFTRETKIRRQ